MTLTEKTQHMIGQSCEFEVIMVMSEYLQIDFEDFRKFLTSSPLNIKAKQKTAATKTNKSVWIEQISYVLSETTIVLNDYPDETSALVTDKDLLRVLMGDLWIMYYGGKSQRLWDGLDRYSKESEILRVRQEELMATVKRRFLLQIASSEIQK